MGLKGGGVLRRRRVGGGGGFSQTRCIMEKEGMTRREAVAAGALATAGALGLAALSGEATAAGGEEKEAAKTGPTKLFVVTDKNGNIVGTGPIGRITHKGEG